MSLPPVPEVGAGMVQNRRGLRLARDGASTNEHDVGETVRIVGSTIITDSEDVHMQVAVAS